MGETNFEYLFKPRSVAVIGASNKEGKIGYSVLKGLISGNYQGKIYPVNVNESEVQGLKAYKSISDVPDDNIDIAVFAIPAKFCIKVAEECGQKGVRFGAVITSGFSEVGNVEAERGLVEVANRYGMRIIGPNIMGVLSNPVKCNASFCPVLPYPGKIALISQSGAMAVAADMKAWLEKIGFSYLISVGNMADVQFDELIDYLDTDPDVDAISLYIEGLKDGRNFMKAARRCRKPIVALKGGVSARGVQAAASHTGSLAGIGKVFEAAIKQCGILKADNLDMLFARSKALAAQPAPSGDNILIITNGGGVGVLATDALELYGIPLKAAPEDVQQEMRKYMPSFGSLGNPIDMTGMAAAQTYGDAVRAALEQDWVDALIVLYSQPATTDPVEIFDAVAQAIEDSKVTTKPVVVGLVGGKRCNEAVVKLTQQGIPSYDSVEVAANAMAALCEFTRFEQFQNAEFVPYTDVDKDTVRKLIDHVRAEGKGALNELESKEAMAAYGLDVVTTRLAKTEDEAVKLAGQIGYPVVMKIVSPDILHKSDADGVKVGIKDEAKLRATYSEIIQNARRYNSTAEILGIAIQEMAPVGTEVIVGSTTDSAFGPVMMFGLGGIFVEVLKDVVFRVAPVSQETALKMMEEIKSYPILTGIRGESPRDVAVMAEMISRMSQLVYDFDEIKESDANPIFLYQKGGKIVDARIILK
ncbi:MAG: acetate--CoA ligase family protein [Dehalococcoidales bacterium]|nr:acetate--CoA ligase family protein [Dehalococcoidales bacterium]